MHRWDDHWFKENGSDLNDAINYISTFCRRWGRLGGDAKEKWGCVRFYVRFHWQLHDLIYVGHCYIKWGKFWQKIDNFYFSCAWLNPIKNLIVRYQEFIYRKAYMRAVGRWPHLAIEILCDADYKELFTLPMQRVANQDWKSIALPGEILYSIDYKTAFAVLESSKGHIYVQSIFGDRPNWWHLFKTENLRFWDGRGVV